MKYNTIYFIKDRSYLHAAPIIETCDLVLTLDFFVFNYFQEKSIAVKFFDHLASPEFTEKFNHSVYQFVTSWYKNGDKDIFKYREFNFGDSFQIAIWTEITQFASTFISAVSLKNYNYVHLITIGAPRTLIEILEYLKIDYSRIDTECLNTSTYYFQIDKWMNEKLEPRGLKPFLRHFLSYFFSQIFFTYDKLISYIKKTNLIFISRYHPTAPIINELNKSPDLKIIQDVMPLSAQCLKNGTFFKNRWCHISKRYSKKTKKEACEIFESWKKARTSRIIIDEYDISEMLYKIIELKVFSNLPIHISAIKQLTKLFARFPISLYVAYSNIGLVNNLVMNYCKQKSVASFLIMDGLQCSMYLQEQKNATIINSYGNEIKSNYYTNMDNVVCLGDPRMDAYMNRKKERTNEIVVAIGAAGFSNIDLNSYVGHEFHFMHSVLKALSPLVLQNDLHKIIIKVRPNGYIDQYRSLVEEYFNNLPIEIVDATPMQTILQKSDIYISFYSQTLFEAIAMGIPAFYFKNDTQFFSPPFGGNTDLPIIKSTDELTLAIRSQLHSLQKYGLDKEAIEKYVGKLDGKSTERNVKYIRSML